MSISAYLTPSAYDYVGGLTRPVETDEALRLFIVQIELRPPLSGQAH